MERFAFVCPAICGIGYFGSFCLLRASRANMQNRSKLTTFKRARRELKKESKIHTYPVQGVWFMRLLEAVEDADRDIPLGCPGEPVNPCPQPIENLDKTTGSPIGPVIPSAVEPQGQGSGGDPVQIIENIEGGHRVT